MLQAADIVIRLNAADDVVIARIEIPNGTLLVKENVRANVLIPAGHKIATRDIAASQPIRRYNQIIGFATRDIKAGDHVHVHNVSMGDFERDYAYCVEAKPTDFIHPQATFQGIVRQDGRVATRNYIGIITSVNCSATVARLIARQFENRLDDFPNVDGVVALTHKTGCGMASDGEAIDILRRTTAGYIRHANFHSVLLVGLGCESNQINNLLSAKGLKRSDHLHAYTIQDKGGTRKAVEEGVARTTDYQDAAYASLYLDRIEPILAFDREKGGGGTGYKLTNETARFLALWMSYEDVIRVADLKTRRSRFERVRNEVRAKPHEPVQIVEFLKPGVEEIAAVMPSGIASAMLNWEAGRRKRGLPALHKGMYIKTNSITGFLMLRTLAWLRPLRRKTSRFPQEQALIERWLRAVANAGNTDLELALEVALLGRLIKGYGDTHQRGKDNFLRIMDTLVEAGTVRDPQVLRMTVRAARDAALADPDGKVLDGSLEKVGVPRRPVKAHPIQIVRRKPGQQKAT